jgi:ABC-type polysaccharide/polyol phosphate export permease
LRNFFTLTRIRMRLALRNRLFVFFSVIMPMGFFFLYAGFFGKGEPHAVKYLLGPVLALTVMGSFWGLSAALVTFREQGILRRFRVAPVTASDMLASSIAANYFLTLPTVIVELLLARWIYHVQDMGNLISLAILITVGTVSFASLGLVVASVTNTMQETQIICQIIWFALLFLSGATLPLPVLPRVVQSVAVFLPATYLVRGLQGAIFDNAGVWRLLVEIFPLLAWAVLTFFMSTRLFRWDSEEKATRRAKLWAVATILPFVLLGFWENKYGSVLTQARSSYSILQGAPSSTSSNPGR